MDKIPPARPQGQMVRTTHVSSEWNPLDFQCTMYCGYCPEKGHSKVPILRPEEEAEMPRHYSVWVNETTDLFCPEVPDSIIEAIFERASREGGGKCFLICSKNPSRFFDFLDKLPPWSLIVTTVESDIDHGWSKAPPPLKRLEELRRLKFALSALPGRRETAICIQPVMKFTGNFVEAIHQAMPDQVGIGMELTGLKNFPAPEFSEVMDLARAVSRFTSVNIHGTEIFPDTHLDGWPEGEEKRRKIREKYGINF